MRFKYTICAAAILGAAMFPAPLLAQNSVAGSTNVLTGAAAYGSYETNKPGVIRLITPADLPAPFTTKSASNAPGHIERPAGAVPAVVDGFKVELVATGYEQPR